MYTINNNYKYELIVKNSRFITLLYKINNDSNIDNILENIKKEYPDATHYCYGYITKGIQKCSDDGEPSGTAGMPILKVLEANNLTNTLAIVIRYFGGIKLGANGLIRAYSKGVANAIKEVELKKLVKGYNVDIMFNYDNIKEIDYLLKDIKINKKEFNDKVIYNIDIDNLEILHNIEYTIIKEIDIEK